MTDTVLRKKINEWRQDTALSMRELSRRTGINIAIISLFMSRRRRLIKGQKMRIIYVVDPLLADTRVQSVKIFLRLKRSDFADSQIAEIGRSLVGMAQSTTSGK